MSLNVTSIPAELTLLPQWVVWRHENGPNGKPTKIPYQAACAGERASSTDPRTWAPFDTAVEAVEAAGATSTAGRGRCDGIGFVFSAAGPFCGIDLDKSLADGRVLKPWAQPFVERLSSYCEVSPSGRGLKLWVRAKLPEKCRHKKNKAGPDGAAIEIYDRERFFTVTGDRWETLPATIEDRQAQVDAIYADLFPAEKETGRGAGGQGQAVGSEATGATGAGLGLAADDATLIERAKQSKNGAAFWRLWGGSISEFSDDHSSADLALCNMLAFWTGPDAGRIDRLFRQSSLCRDKWLNRADYRERTIRLALAGRTEFFEAGISEEDEFVGSARQHANKRSNGVDAAKSNGAEPAAIATSAAIVPHVAAEAKSPRRKIANVIDRAKEVRKRGASDEDEPSIVRWQEYRSLPEIAADILKLSGGWPREAGGMLFALKQPLHPLPIAKDVEWIVSSEKLFSWLGKIADVRWATGVAVHPQTGERLTPPTKSELFEYLTENACDSYRGVEYLPHSPPIDDIYYLPVHLPPLSSSLSPLQQLVQQFNGENEIDKALMLAALLTPGWSGVPGTKPTFVFTSDYGRGTGKTTTAVVLAEVWGGAVQIRPRNADWEKVCGRLLGDAAMNKRILFIDNVKGTLAGSEIEGLITSPNIDGWKPYVGQASRPNLFTWYLTMNATRFSSDITDRSVCIKIGKQKHEFNFNEWGRKLIERHRAEMLAEIFDMLDGQALCEISKASRDRWGGWQDAILTRFDIGNDMAQAIIDRRPAMNADLETAEAIAAAVMELAVQYRPHVHEHSIIRITREQLRQKMVLNGIVEKSTDIRTVTSIVLDQLGSGPLNFLQYEKTHVDGVSDRFWFYRGLKTRLDIDLRTAINLID